MMKLDKDSGVGLGKVSSYRRRALSGRIERSPSLNSKQNADASKGINTMKRKLEWWCVSGTWKFWKGDCWSSQ